MIRVLANLCAHILAFWQHAIAHNCVADDPACTREKPCAECVELDEYLRNNVI